MYCIYSVYGVHTYIPGAALTARSVRGRANDRTRPSRAVIINSRHSGRTIDVLSAMQRRGPDGRGINRQRERRRERECRGQEPGWVRDGIRDGVVR